MLRILVISSAFLIVTIGLLMIQPTPRSDRFVDETVVLDEVTRSEATLLDVSLPDPTLTEVAKIVEPEIVTPASTPAPVAVTQQPVTVAAPVPSGINIEGLEELVKVALERQMSGEQIDQWLEQAAASGVLTIPPYMRRADGTLDTPMILSTLVEAPSAATISPKTGKPYIVKAGDSLASIAFENYGTTDPVEEIYWANKDRLASPDKISVGQTRYLPAL